MGASSGNMQLQGSCSFCGVSLLVRICLLCLGNELSVTHATVTNFDSISIKHLMKLVCFRKVFINEW